MLDPRGYIERNKIVPALEEPRVYLMNMSYLQKNNKPTIIVWIKHDPVIFGYYSFSLMKNSL